MAGCPTVIIGSSVQSFVIQVSATNGTPFCEECEKKRQQQAALDPGIAAIEQTSREPFDDRFQLVDEANGEPLRNQAYVIKRSTGAFESGRTDSQGFTSVINNEEHPENVEIYLGGADHKAVTAHGDELAYDEQVQVIDSRTKLPITDYPFFIELASGETRSGRTDAQGKLPRVTTSATETLKIYWGDEALFKADEE